MGRKPQDEIQKKLVELELSIKEDEAKNVPAAKEKKTTLVASDSDSDSKAVAEIKTSIDMHQYGGYALMGIGLLMVLSQLQIGWGWGMFGAMPALGLLLVPLLIGIGMLFYNYKSKVAQAVTGGSFLALLVSVIMSTRVFFAQTSVLDFILLAAPIAAGVALLAKANVKRQELKELTKSDQ